MSRLLVAILSCLTVVSTICSAQQPPLPAQQAKYCSIMENWASRGGYAPGAAPKTVPNPIKEAQDPKPAGPGNLFDQLIELFGTSGTLTGWKGTVIFGVDHGDRPPSVNVDMIAYCPRESRGYDVRFTARPPHNIPLNSPLAQWLSETGACQKSAEGTTSCTIENATVSGHFIYNAASRFYDTGSENPRGLGTKVAGLQFRLVPIERINIQITNISKSEQPGVRTTGEPTPQTTRAGGNEQVPNLIQRVEPVYPASARQARIQGVVRFRVTIGKDGRVHNPQTLSGHPMLVTAALDAVKQWVYKPALLNGQPVEAVTTADVTFSLNPQ